MNITERILYLVPNAKFLCKENDYNQITWYSGNTKELPSLIALQAIPQADIDAQNPALQRQKDIIDNLPSWSQVSQAIDNIGSLADAKAFIKKLARVVYWLSKNQGV